MSANDFRDAGVASGDKAVLGVSLGIKAMAMIVLAGWLANWPALVDASVGLIPMPYNTGLCFLSLALAGIGFAVCNRWLQLGGAIFTGMVGAASIAQYMTGSASGVDTMFFRPPGQDILAEPGRMALTTGINFLLMGSALAFTAIRPAALAVLGIASSLTLSVALMALIGHLFQLSYLLPARPGSPTTLYSSLAFLALTACLLSHAWMRSPRGADGLPSWTAGLGLSLLPVLFGGASASFPGQTWQTFLAEGLFAVTGVALVTFAILRITRGMAGSLEQAALRAKATRILEGHGADVRHTEVLLKTGALQRAIFNSANFSSIATDEKGVIQIFNVGAERMLGYSAAEVMNQITPADISEPVEVIARAEALSRELATHITPGFEALVFKASRGIEDIYELTYIRKDGSRFPAIVSVTALRDAQEGIIGYLLIGTDNTARKQVEAARTLLDQRLRDQQFYTRSLIESNIDALMMTDPQGIISDVNQQMIALTGRTRDELIGAPSKNFFTNPLLAEAAIRRVLTEGKVSNYELTVRALNGEETVVSYNAATFHDRDRKLLGVFAAARDVTERKRFEHTLQEKNVELEHASRMKSEFLATMSHELRTPLNAIIGFSEALKDGLIGPTSTVQQEYIGDIFSSGQHLLSLINDILDLSKVEAGMMALELEPVDLNILLSNSLSIVKEKMAAQRISLEMAVGDDLGMPLLDLRKTKQIIYNLLSNAVKFSAPGGRISVTAQRVPRNSVGVFRGSWPHHGFALADSGFGEFLEICVGDTGIGISRKDMARLFQAFVQIDSSLARKFEGTGLGLAMVKQLAELHGGTVAVASTEGRGTYFAVWLPLRRPDLAASPQSHLVTSSLPALTMPGARTALVVEDDDMASDLLRLLLEGDGFTVVRAATAEAALSLMGQQTFSLITLDITLPGIGGWELLKRIRACSNLAAVPVVVISAGLEERASALAQGASELLLKPVSRAQLKTSLASLGLAPLDKHTHTVLLVDDDPKAIEVIAAFLPAPAYQITRATGGHEAIALARQLMPDLILLDLLMPDVSGIDVVEALRAQKETARIPILVVTAKQVTQHDHATLNCNPERAIRVVQKAGFNSATFLDEVRRALLAA